jgi:phosphoglycolate phosphatase
MVGDTVFDVEGAAKCGIPTVGVSWGFGKAEDMLSAGAKTVVSNMEELFEAIN